MKKQIFNPILPSWEYLPDGEPRVFDGRVYIFGSHDKFAGHVFCPNDYVAYSAPVEDLTDWRLDGEIYAKTDDPLNPDGRMNLFAPDVTRGPDGRYYLYYVLDKVSCVSVAVCDKPAGKYEFYGYVSRPDGTRVGEGGDQPCFDPTVHTEGDKTFLYYGFCGEGQTSREGAFAVVLAADMLTVIEEPVRVLPGRYFSDGTDFVGREFFEAPSIRKHDGLYFLVYSSIACRDLCYATSAHPTKDFVYRGAIVTNNGGNNHGGIAEIAGSWYIFYHRHTNGNQFSRQACAERIEMRAGGEIPKVETTSCGLNGGPLIGRGEYPAHIACELYGPEKPIFSQDGRDGDQELGYVKDIASGCGAAYKYFDCRGVKRIKIKARAYADGIVQVKTAHDGAALCEIRVHHANIWTEFSADAKIPDGVQALYFEFTGQGSVTLAAFTLEAD